MLLDLMDRALENSNVATETCKTEQAMQMKMNQWSMLSSRLERHPGGDRSRGVKAVSVLTQVVKAKMEEKTIAVVIKSLKVFPEVNTK